jgi:hypothetical protein
MVADHRSLEKACGTPQITRKNRFVLPASHVGGHARSEKSAILLSPRQPLVKLVSPRALTGYN